MTAKHGDDDDLEFTDETFVINDEDEARDLDDVLAQVEQEVEGHGSDAAAHRSRRGSDGEDDGAPTAAELHEREREQAPAHQQHDEPEGELDRDRGEADLAEAELSDEELGFGEPEQGGATDDDVTAEALAQRVDDATEADQEDRSDADIDVDADADDAYADAALASAHTEDEDDGFPTGEHVAFADEVTLDDDEEVMEDGGAAAEGSADDILFTLGSDIVPAVGSETFGTDSPTFQESGGGWGGDAMQPEDIGIDVGGEPVGPYGGKHGARAQTGATAGRAAADPWADEQARDDGDGAAYAAADTAAADEEFFADEGGDADLELAAASAGGLDAEHEQLDEELHEAQEGEENEDWAPISAHDDALDGDGGSDDPIYGDDQSRAAAAAAQTAADAEPDFEEYEEHYVDAVPRRRLLGGGRLRGRRFAVTAAATAAVLLLGVAGVITLVRPQWLGLGAAPALVDRVQIARPTVEMTIEAPAAFAADGSPSSGASKGSGRRGELPAGDPNRGSKGTDPATSDPATGDPTTAGRGGRTSGGGDPTSTEPRAADPAHGDPSAGDPVARDPALDNQRPSTATEPVKAGGADDDPFAMNPSRNGIGSRTRPDEALRLGDDLAISTQPMTTSPRDQAKLDPRAAGLTPGSQAFAQLHNLNFFIGHVKAMDGDHITMRLDKGEITFSYASLKTLVPLTSSEFLEMQRSTGRGYVMLHNNNRLFGTIIEQPKEENVVLEMKSNRVMIPRASIESIGNDLPTGIKFTDDENDEWVRKLIQGQMQAMPTRPSDPMQRGKVKMGPETLDVPAPQGGK